MTHSHRILARSLAAFLIIVQALAGGAIAIAHSGQASEATTIVAAGGEGGDAVHGEQLCPLCLLANSHAQDAPATYVTSVAAIASQPEILSDVTPRATSRPLTSASPRAPPTLLA